MSLLAPLYVLGALAVAAPVVFHLIRRSPRGEVPFSSLMFLSPTPPRLTRRSRLDDLLLLLLRAAALGLLAFAFARPFLRESARLDSGEATQSRVAVLVDTSASMRRGDLWDQAKRLAGEAIAACRPGDELAVFAFDGTARPVLGFAESAALDPARRHAVARARLGALAPTWAGTDLGQALIDAVGALDDVADRSEKAGRMPRRVVLVSDLQQGSRLDALGLFEWPSDVELELKAVADDRPNAGLQRLADASETGQADDALRVRVTNDADSRQERFRLAWADGRGATVGRPVEAYVPPGQSRVVRVARPSEAAAQSLRLTGDAHEFDNTLFVADEREEEAVVLYVGEDEADAPSGLLYYLDRAFRETSRRAVSVRAASPDAALEPPPDRSVSLVVLAAAATPENVERLRAYLRDGGTVLCVLRSPDQAETLAGLTGGPPAAIEEASVDGDVMLGEIDFGHPLFAPFAGPQYNDFTKIRFWKYRRLTDAASGEARVVAEFETGDPAVVERSVEKGRLVVLTAGWNPEDSQLARSSKFVPLLLTLLERPGVRSPEATDLVVNAAVPLPSGVGGNLVVRKPDGTAVEVEPGHMAFAGTDQPGVYRVESPDGPGSFAVNLDPAESRTSPLPVETLERFGVRLAGGEAETPAEAAERRRQMLNAELEGRQKLWRWLILAAVGVLIVETWLAGRVARPRPAVGEAQAT